VLIHPFGDGNGRMGRLVMNYVLQKFGYPALILKGDNENRQLYYRAIHQACMGNVRAFVRYIAEQMLRTLLVWILNCTIIYK
jgi:Fic family protein